MVYNAKLVDPFQRVKSEWTKSGDGEREQD